MTLAEERARERRSDRAWGMVFCTGLSVFFLMVLGYGLALVYDKWREVLDKHNALLFVFSLDGLVLGAVACTCVVVGFVVGLVKGLTRGGKA